MKIKKPLSKIFILLFAFIFIFTGTGNIKVNAATGNNNSIGQATPVSIERQEGEDFSINFTVQPEDIRAKDVAISNSSNKEIVLIIDTSGSMNDYIKGKKKLNTIKEATNSFIDKFSNDKNAKIAVVAYSGKAKVLGSGLTNNDGFNALKAEVNKLSPEGTTNIGDGLRKAYYLLNNGNANADKSIILMTDGAPTAYSAEVGSVKYYKYESLWQIPEGYILNSKGEEIVFHQILEYKFETTNQESFNSVAYYGEYNETAMEYVEAIGSLVKANNKIDSYVVGLGYGVNNDDLKRISDSVEGTYVKASSGDEIIKLYNQIGDDISSSISTAASFNMIVPDGLEVTTLPSGLKVENGVVSGTIGNINYNIAEDGNNGGGNDYYKANPISFSIGFKGKDTNGNKTYVINGGTTFASYTVSPKSFKQQFNNVNINIKDKITLSSQLSLTQSLSPSVTGNKYKKDQSFYINYIIDPSQGINKSQYDQLYKRDKEIVLVIDTSGSMADALDEDDNGASTIVKIKYNGTWYDVQAFNQSAKTIKFNNNVYDLIDYDSNDNHDWVVIDDKPNNKSDNKRCKVIWGHGVPNSRLDMVKDAAENFISKFSSSTNVKIGVVSYSSYGEVVKGLTDSSRTSELNNAINSLEPVGGTNIGDGLRRAYGMLDNGSNADKYVILMSDGYPTAFTSYTDGLDYNSSYYQINGEIIEGDDVADYFKDITKYSYKLNNDSESESFVVNYGNEDYNGLAMEYSKRAAEYTKNFDINSFFVGFSNGVDSEKLKEIADSAGGYYSKALNNEALNEVYNKIADEIKLPSIKNIKFEIKLPAGLVAEEVKSTNSQEPLEGFYIEDEGKLIVGTIDNITYSLQQTVGGVAKYVVDDATKERLKFTIKLKGITSGNYVLGDTQNPAYITYTDVDESSQRKDFTPIINLEIVSGNVSVSITDFGIFTNEFPNSVISNIKSGNVDVYNGFTYDLGWILNIGDVSETGASLDNDISLKINASGINTVDSSRIKLYGLVNGKLTLIYSWKDIINGNIIIPKDKVKIGESYILTQSFIPNVSMSSTEPRREVNVSSDITINNSINLTKNLTLTFRNDIQVWPDLD